MVPSLQACICDSLTARHESKVEQFPGAKSMNTYNFKGTNWLKFFVGFAIAVSFAWSPRVAHADPEQDAILMGRPLLRQNGKLFVIQFAPKARRVDILTAGKSVATLDPSSVKIFGRVFPIGGSPHDL